MRKASKAKKKKKKTQLVFLDQMIGCVRKRLAEMRGAVVFNDCLQTCVQNNNNNNNNN